MLPLEYVSGNASFADLKLTTGPRAWIRHGERLDRDDRKLPKIEIYLSGLALRMETPRKKISITLVVVDEQLCVYYPIYPVPIALGQGNSSA